MTNEPEMSLEQAERIQNAFGLHLGAPPKRYARNFEAERIVGRREVESGAVVINSPCEMGYHCPVCQYPQFGDDGEYDERLEWSEYNAFLYCHVCDKDYPSALCLLGPENINQAIDVFLASVADAVGRATMATVRPESTEAGT